MKKLNILKNIYKNEKENKTERDDVLIYNVIYYLWKNNTIKFDPSDLENDILTFYDNILYNSETIDDENLNEYIDYLKKNKACRLNYYINKITKDNKFILITYFYKNYPVNCFYVFDKKDYWKISE